jgi:hypothetical protein
MDEAVYHGLLRLFSIERRDYLFDKCVAIGVFAMDMARNTKESTIGPRSVAALTQVREQPFAACTNDTKAC